MWFILVRALVLLNVTTGNESLIVQELRKLGEVISDTFITFGDYDIACIITANSPRELGQLVTGRVRHINGVQRTVTLIEAVENKKNGNHN